MRLITNTDKNTEAFQIITKEPAMRYFLRGDGSDTAIASAESDDAALARLADGWREVMA